MADMAAVNKAIRQRFPDLDIKAVRGKGYVYFDGDDGFNVVASIYSNPPSTHTKDMIDMAIDEIYLSIEKAYRSQDIDKNNCLYYLKFVVAL